MSALPEVDRSSASWPTTTHHDRCRLLPTDRLGSQYRGRTGGRRQAVADQPRPRHTHRRCL